jgi:hypothetical protein
VTLLIGPVALTHTSHCLLPMKKKSCSSYSTGRAATPDSNAWQPGAAKRAGPSSILVMSIHVKATLDALLPVYSKRRRFVNPPKNSTSPTQIRRISRPPPAASAAGGRGIPVSCRVYSVGALRSQAAGVLEVEARRLVFAGGGSPLRRWTSVKFCRRSTATVVLASPRRCRGRLPLARLRGRRIRQIGIYQKKMRRFGSSTAALSGVGPPGPAIGNFPLARGLPLIQGFKGGSGDGAPPTAAVGRRRGQLAVGLCCIFVFVGDLSVMFPN